MTQNASERSNDRPQLGVGRELDVVLEADEGGRLAELLGEAVLLQGGDDLPDQRVADAEEEDEDGGDEEEVRNAWASRLPMVSIVGVAQSSSFRAL